MNGDNNVLCCACLCGDRKMVPLEGVSMKRCFLEIVNEMPMDSTTYLPITVCWECNALISRFIKFKRQAKKCFKNLNEYTKKNMDVVHLKRAPILHTHQIFNLHFDPNIQNELEVTVDVIKLENSVKSEIKPEILDTVEENNLSSHSDNFDDDTKLIEYSNRKKKKKLKVRKKRKEKNDETDVIKEIELTMQELTEERRMLVEREEYEIAMYRCENCIITFPNIDDLNDHKKVKHELNKSKFKCSICECTFATEMSYNYHVNKHMKRYQCTVCNERFKSKGAGTKHYETIHLHISYDETAYENRPKTKCLEQNESEKQDARESFPCEFCDKIFRWKTSLRKHIEMHRIETGQKRKPYCEPCRLSFSTTFNLQKHTRTSSKHKIQLKLWKLKESNSDALGSEEQIVSSVNRSRQLYMCPQCGRSFQWRGNLRRHVTSHCARANGELVCEPCNRTFSSIATYKQHMMISKKHNSESDFKYMCSDCGKRFANKTRLKDHVDWEHLKNFVHTCTVCQKVFKSHTSLYIHKQVVHKKDSVEHLCDHCGKPFPNRTKLRIHMVALHSGKAQYACARCPAKFNWQSCLSRHSRRVHTTHNA